MAKKHCPQCKKETVQAYRPFCSKRCADLDLGNWFQGNYVLAGDTEVPSELPNDDTE